MLVRAALLALLAALAASGALRLWQMMVIVAIYGAAQAFFDPASDAILPEILPASQLGEANALEQLARPLDAAARRARRRRSAGRRARPRARPFSPTAPTFMVSAATLWSMSARAVRRTAGRRSALPLRPSLAASCCEGWSYVRRHVWLWGTFASAGIAYLLFMGPAEVLLPFMVKHELGGSGISSASCSGRAASARSRARCADGPQRTSLAEHHLHLRRLDARDGGGGGIRAGHRDVAADAGEPRLQSPRDGGHDRVVDDEAAARPRRAARTRIQPRLADLDRAVAGVVRPDGAAEPRRSACARP